MRARRRSLTQRTETQVKSLPAALAGSALSVLLSLGPAAPQAHAGEAAAQPAASPETVAPGSPLRFGLDLYTGIATLPGSARNGYLDGVWAGSGPAFPSEAYVRWGDGEGQAAKVAVGLGGMYTGSGTSYHQPVEAWWRIPAGKVSVTLGKVWVPFGLQEWQYETKPGMMLQWANGPYTVAASANYNENTRRPNAYLHASRAFGSAVTLGASLGAGRGLTYDSVHGSAWGVDATAVALGWRLSGEYLDCRHDSGSFRFGFGKLQCERLGAWKPFVAGYSWSDRAGDFPTFRSAIGGVDFQVNPNLSLEAAYAATHSQGAWWAQAHWNWER